MIDEQQALYGIVGYPVQHSLSPLMHNAAFKQLGSNARYDLFPLKEEELDGFFKKLKDPESAIGGLNVTVPYKEKALKYLDVLTPFAKKVGAVNTIVITDDRKLIGYNTDAPGFLSHLTELRVGTAGKQVALLGAGGASRAIICALCLIPERPEAIRIYDMVKEKADALIHELSERIDLKNVESVHCVDDLFLEVPDVLINATPIGMHPGDPALIGEESLHAGLFVYDLVYNPPQTPLLKLAQARGAQTANGLGMLYYQGVLAFQHWAGGELDDRVKTIMREALTRGMTTL